MRIIVLGGLTNPKGIERIESIIKGVEKEFERQTGTSIELQHFKYIPYVDNEKKKYMNLWGMKEVSEAINEKLSPAEEYIFICHSTGGLIARYLVEKLGVKAKLILIATPNRGINLPWYQRLGLRLLVGRIPTMVKDMMPNSKFLKSLGLPSPEYYYVVAKQDTRVPIQSAAPFKNNSVVVNTDHGLEKNMQALTTAIVNALIKNTFSPKKALLAF